MRKILLILAALFFAGQAVIGQTVSQYNFSQSTGTYTAISGGTVITPIQDTIFDGNSYASLNIGFNFTWRGTVFTQFGLAEDGFIGLGSTLLISSDQALSADWMSNDVIAAFNADLVGVKANGAEIRYQTLGTAPNRYLVVQFKNFGFYTNSGNDGLPDFNFQVQLYETSNIIKIVYGPYAGIAGNNFVQVGLRGASSADFNDRTTTTDWSATTAGSYNYATCKYNPPTFVIPANGLTFSWAPPPPCATPAAQPTNLVLTPISTTVLASWTASATADKYLVIRSLSSTLGATPVNGTVYTAGSTFGSGVVDYWGSGTSYSSLGLTPGTPYYYWVFAAHNFCVGAPPLYLTTGPLSGNTTTLPLTPRCGNLTVGPTGFFPSLTWAFLDLASNGVCGAVNLQLQATYSSTVETFPITAGAIPGTSITSTVTVYPLAEGLSVTSESSTGTILLSSATYVTFDGRVNGTGPTKSLILDNLTGGYTVGFQNGARYNGVKYCIVKGANTRGSKATIQFLRTTTTSGNSYNTIDNCEVRNGSDTPLYAIASSGSTLGTLFNMNNTVSNCLIHDFAAPGKTGGNPIGVGMLSGSTGWTITGNSFYMTNVLDPGVAAGYYVIYIASGDGYTVSNNYIGGSAPLCGGTPWTLNGNGTPPTLANFIHGIRFHTGCLYINASTVTNNTVANILLYTTPWQSNISFTGFISKSGIQNVTGNVIGSGTGTGSIVINVAYKPGYGHNYFTSGIDFQGGYGNVMNNTIGSITLNSPAAYVSIYPMICRMINFTTSDLPVPVTVSGNIIGSLTTANSIQSQGNTTPPVWLYGINIQPSYGSTTMTVTNNTVANLTNLNSKATSVTLGLNTGGTSVVLNLSGNTIRDITGASQNLTATAASVVGLYSNNSVPGSIVRGNTIYNLKNTEAALGISVNGMYINHTDGSLLLEKNYVHNIETATTAVTGRVNGIYINCAGARVTARNNMVQLGVNADGTPNTACNIIAGIYETGAAIDSVLNNSVYIGGAPSSTTGNTYAFQSTITPSLSSPRVYLNNIFYNARSGGATGLHYGIAVGGT
ncbi:MAG: hypothetical protein WCM93_10215, partial [Bacteroidota bacterium]